MNIQKQKQVGDIIKFKDGARDLTFAVAVLANNFLYNKRLNTWNDWSILSNQTGIILEARSIKNTIKPEYQKYYHEEEWKPYLWYCFRTAKIYLVYECEME